MDKIKSQMLSKVNRLGLDKGYKTPKLRKVNRLGTIDTNTQLNTLIDELDSLNLKSFVFEAGFGEGQHGGIELEALKDIFIEDEIYQIYYGNWLRDYSQLVTKATIRPYNSPVGKIKNISHEGWADLIKILAVKEFAYKLSKEKQSINFKDYEAVFKKKYEAKATRKKNGDLLSFKDVLGIYRPEEHIDNPKDLDPQDKLDDGTKLNISFSYEYALNQYVSKGLYKGEVEESLEINPSWFMKNYIIKDIDPERPSSDSYATQQIKLALLKGKNKEGFRHLGAFFHVLEDFFAHTNFVEVALRKQGHHVYPWIEGMETEDDFKKIPIVTGKFLIDDTIASIAQKMANTIFPSGFEEYKRRKVGDKTFTDIFILKYLDDLSKSKNKQGEKVDPLLFNVRVSTWKTVYSNYIAFIDAKSKAIEEMGLLGRALDLALQRIGEFVNTANNIFFNLFLESTNEDIKEEQTLRSNKNYGTDPTHTQIAKDPLDHPLNGLATRLAIEAVKAIGEQVADYWRNPSEEKLSNIISTVMIKYMQHPKDNDLLDDYVIKWADENPNKIFRAKSSTFAEHTHKTIERNINKTIIERFVKIFE